MLLPTPAPATDQAPRPPVRLFAAAVVYASTPSVLSSFVNNGDDPWFIRRLSVVGPASSTATVYIGDPVTDSSAAGIDPSRRVDCTRAGELDTATYDVPLFLPAGLAVHVVWDLFGPTMNATLERLG